MRLRRPLILGVVAVGLIAACTAAPLDVGPSSAGESCDPARTSMLCPVVEPDPEQPEQPRRFNPAAVAVDKDGRRAFVALRGSEAEPGNQLVVIDINKGTLARRIGVGDRPSSVTIHHSGDFALVTSWYARYVTVVDLRSYETRAIDLSFYLDDADFLPAGDTVVISDRWRDGIWIQPVIASEDGATLPEQGRRFIATGINPSGVSVCPDGDTAVVATSGSLGVTVVRLASGVSSLVDLNAPVNDVECLGASALVATLGQGSGHPGRGSAECEALAGLDGATCDDTANTRFSDIQNDIAVIDVASATVLRRFTSDTAEFGALDVKGAIDPARMKVRGAFPRAIARNDARAWVTMYGSGEVQEIDLGVAETYRGADLVTPRMLSAGLGPAGVAVTPDGSTLVVANELSEDVSLIDLATGQERRVVVGNADPPFPATTAEIGELYFSTAYFSSDGDGSCLHCHPDRSTDGKAWSVATVLLGASRQVPPTRNLRATRPLFLEGTQTEDGFNLEMEDLSPRADYADGFDEGAAARDAEFRRLTSELVGEEVGFDEMVLAVGDFLIVEPRLLPNPNDPHAEAAQRGRVLFESPAVGCAACHEPDKAFTTDRLFTNVIALFAGDRPNRELPPSIAGTFMDVRDGVFDTPSLRGTWDRPARFLHDGRASNVAETILPPGHDALAPEDEGFNFTFETTTRDSIPDTHGGCSHLTTAQVTDLLAYIDTL